MEEGQYDATQVELMEEKCIMVNEQDECIGFESKKARHLMDNIRAGALHRAFSVFLFNSKGQLLLQQRADEKITFPGYWTNTVCSHPLYKLEANVKGTYGATHEDELEETNALGVKRAAQRKLVHEMGIHGVELDEFTYLTRIHYEAPSDGKWGEHEIDYILFVQKDVEPDPNPNEVQAYRWVSKDELDGFMTDCIAKGLKMTPWFQLVVKSFIYKWWDCLADLRPCVDAATIHHMKA